MRIVFFNIWHGKYLDRLNKFFDEERGKTDIFCLTEVDPELLQELIKIFPGYKNYFSEVVTTSYLNGGMEGQAIFLKDNINNRGYRKHFIYEVNENDAGVFETLEIDLGEKHLLLGSVHAMAKPGTKNDTPARINQSNNILNTVKDFSGPVVIGGDFNLNPDTESIEILEKAGFDNLIKKFQIKDTRGPINRDLYKDTVEGVQYFADYVFTNNQVVVNDFRVPQIDASDHLPLILEFKI